MKLKPLCYRFANSPVACPLFSSAAKLFALLFFSSFVVSAAELPPGTVINASNIDTFKNDTFEQHPISELIPPSIERLIREFKLNIKIKHSEKYPLDSSLVSLTKKYSPSVRLNEKTKQIENYVAGIAFPDIRPDDPNAGYKVMWNSFLLYSLINNGEIVSSSLLLIDQKKGLEQVQSFKFAAVPMVGRVDEPHVIGKGDIAKRELLVFTDPYDLRGLGTFTIRYMDGRPDETSAYLKSVRRIRRLTGGAWMDPVGGADYLYDDINGFNAHPSWYKDFRYIKRKWILGLVLRTPPRAKGGATLADEFTGVDLKNPPYWNPTMDWEPVEVDIVEAITPPEHPYSKKVYYFSVDIPGYAKMGEFYNKKGTLWKIDLLGSRAKFVDTKGRKIPAAGYMNYVIDILRGHASVTFGWDVTRIDLQPEDVSIDKLLEVVK